MIVLNFDIWTGSNRWRKFLFWDIHIILERVFFRGYKWTPFCKITKIARWNGTEEDKAAI